MCCECEEREDQEPSGSLCDHFRYALEVGQEGRWTCARCGVALMGSLVLLDKILREHYAPALTSFMMSSSPLYNKLYGAKS